MATATSMADKYEVLEKIGQGSFGVIRKVRRKADGYVLCRKEICYGRMSQKERDQLHAELKILQGLRHANIVAYYEREHLKASQDLHIYMEYCGNGDLGMMIKDLKARNDYADEELVWTIFAQLVSALYRCHSGEDPPSVDSNALGLAKNVGPLKSKTASPVLHRDLKPDNVFLGDGHAVKLGDFGLSKIMDANGFAFTYVGTPFYMSPEINANERYTLFADIWALGCIIYELCSREPPFNARNHLELAQKIRIGKVAPLPQQYSRELREVVSLCLQVNPNSRPDTAYLLNLPRVKLARKQQENRMVLQREIDAKNRALKDLEAVKQQIAQILADKEAEKQALHDQMDQKLRLEWETRATLKINEIKEDLCKQFEQRVTEEVEKRLASLPSSQTNSLSSADIESSLPPRSSTPTEENYAGHSFDTAGTSEEDDLPSGTDLTSLSIEDSPTVQRQRPLSSRKSARTPFTRARTIANDAAMAPSPMDIHMADPSPMSIASLSLSPRRTAVQEGSKLRQAPLSGGNIFAKAAMREPAVALFPPHEEADEEDDDDDDDDGEGDDGGADSRSPIQSRFSQDPFKVLEQPGLGGLRARPGLSRAKTSVPMGHARLHSTPSFAVPAPAAAAAAAVGHRKTPSAADQRRPSSPAARPGIPRALAVSPRRNAPAAPSQPSPTALRVRTAAAKTAKPTGAGAGAGKEDMVRAAHRNNMQGASAAAAAAGLQGKTLPELARSQEKASAGDNKPGANAFGAIRKENVPPLPPARWDPNEVDDMPSPFLKRNSRPVSALR